MYLPATRSTPEVDFRQESLPVLRLSGPCYPFPCEPFFKRILDGSEADRQSEPGLRRILDAWPHADSPRFVFDMHTINSRSEKAGLVDLIGVLSAYNVAVEWISHPSDASNLRVAGYMKQLHTGSFMNII